MSKITSQKLSTGQELPVIALGTWQSKKGEVAKAINAAIDVGYRHIDCASNYQNECEVGEALKAIFDSGKVKREDLFLTSKLNNPDHAKQDVRKACEKTLKDLQIKQLDLYLMHWSLAFPKAEALKQDNPEPKGADGKLLVDNSIPIRETWEAMEELVDAGLVKAIGVCNFAGALLHDLLTYARIKPAVLQIENHPYLQQTPLVDYAQKRGIVVEAYSPLGTPGFAGKGEPVLLEDPKIKELSGKYKKTPAQIVLRFDIQRNIVALPKSVNPERIKENFDVFDFELSADDFKALQGIDRRHRYLRAHEWHGVPVFD